MEFEFKITLNVDNNTNTTVTAWLSYVVKSMRILSFIITTGILIYLTGCASMKPSDFAKGNSNADPIKFFIGKTTSDGVVENRAGKPTMRIKQKRWVLLKTAL